ncbi:porin [Sinisalibacter aestuarii]|uniref:Porin n=1 Tax=Sinisalibacter aestuarii TaxID=2949426 RepID=A0ABQ5LP38_9RHOB|nr:porin [Sinisalibacter aestuarii]GKY86765.1 porin [Sinisalibacter aestuarii]
MKKILLASTILVGTAGFAAADNANFTFSGAAYAGVAYSNLGAGTFAPEVSAEFTAGMMTTTDTGLEAGASVTVSARGLSFDDDYTTTTFGLLSEDGSSISNASVYLSGDWGKVTVTYDDDGSGAGATTTDWDVVFAYSNTWGDFSVNAYYTVAIDGATGTNGDLGVTGTYSFGDYSVYAEYDFDAWDATAAGAEHLVGVGIDATFGAFSAGVDLDYSITNSDLDWQADVAYSSGAYTIGAFVDEDDAGVNWGFDAGLTASYDLGGGVSIDGAAIHDDATDSELFKLGVSMAF